MGSLVRPTSVKYAALSSAYHLLKSRYAGQGAVWKPVKLSYTGEGGAWELRYSTPTGTLSGGGANAASGAATGGRAQVNATATPGGNNSGDLSYQWLGGVSASYSGSTTQTLTGYHDFSGVSNGSTSSSITDTGVYCVITDNKTGAQWQTDPITVGPLSWTNTIPADMPITVSWGGVTDLETGNGASHACSHSTTCTPSGGNGSYLYSWTYISGDASIAIDNPAIQSPTFSATVSSAAHDTGTKSAVWQIDVTDTAGDSHTPVQATVSLSYQRGT